MKRGGGGPHTRRQNHPQPPQPTPMTTLPHQPPPTPQFPSHHRDSDASFASRPSSSFGTTTRPSQITDISYKQSALRSVNSYLSTNKFPVLLSLKPLPSARDITETLKFLLYKVGFACASNKLEDDLVPLLKYLNCPHKINKSAFRTPGAPHSFPLLLAVIHWLVQVADYYDHLRSDNAVSSSLKVDTIMSYSVDSYLAYMKGDDDAVMALDEELAEKMEKETNLLVENLNMKDEEGKKLELELEGLKSMPSEKEQYDSQRKDLELDLDKFEGYIQSLKNANTLTIKALEDKEKELATKVQEIRQTREENEELKKRVEAQGINMRDAERMKRELLGVERDISEAESSRSSWEEKCWDLDAATGHKYKELESLSIECNQALRRIKLRGDFQYALNAKGSTPADVMGINYKSTLKPAINSFADEIKRSTTAKLEEFIALQQQSKELIAKIEAKKNRLAVLQLHIDDRARQLEMMRKEMDEYTSWCASEAQRIKGDVEAEEHNFDVMEREALDTLKAAEIKLQEETRQSEQETQLCAYELYALIDSVSKYKEYEEKKISEMRKVLSESTEFMSGIHKNNLSSVFNITVEP